MVEPRVVRAGVLMVPARQGFALPSLPPAGYLFGALSPYGGDRGPNEEAVGAVN